MCFSVVKPWKYKLYKHMELTRVFGAENIQEDDVTFAFCVYSVNQPYVPLT